MKTFVSPLRIDSIRGKLRRDAVPLLIVGISIMGYGIACILPTIQYDAYSWAAPHWTAREAPGYEPLLFGWAVILRGQFGWCANPLLAIAWIAVLKRRWNAAILWASAAFLIGLHTFTLTGLPGFFKEEDDVVTGFAIGVYVWLGSMLVVVVGAALAGYSRRVVSAKPTMWLRELPTRYLILAAIALLTIALFAFAALDVVRIPQFSDPGSDPTPPVGKIVFEIGETNLYVINADGTGLQPYQAQDMVSPDGAHVAHVKGTNWDWMLCVENSDGSGRTCFENAGIPQWSPDSRSLVFTQFDESTHTTFIGSMNADGTGEKLLRQGMYARWSPDGQLIFYTGLCSAEHPAGGVCAINADGSGEKWVAEGDTASIDWSPDYRRMVLAGAYSEKIYVANADGTNARFIAEGENPDWSPDGTKIAFENPVGNTHETNAIYIVNPDGTGLACLTKGRRDGNPTWSPDGKHIAFESYLDGEDYHIYIMHPDGSHVHRLTNSSARELSPIWLPE